MKYNIKFTSQFKKDIKINIITINNSNKVVKEYIKFTKIIDTNTKKYGYTKKSINETIDYCIKKNILREYLTEYKKEVYNIMTSVYDQKTATEMYERALRAEGMQQGKIELMISMIKDKIISINDAAKKLGISESEILKLM